MTLVIAHRGASAHETENSLAAFRRAKSMGADGIELDVRRTLDDRLVVHHDPCLADGRVIRETRRADLPDVIPELGPAIDACEGMFVNVEIKNDETEPDYDPSDWLAWRTTAALARRGMATRWLISSFRLETVDVCRRLLPSVRTAWLVYEPSSSVIRRASEGGHVAIHPAVYHVTSDSVRMAHEAGLAVNTWTCDDPVRMRELIGWGIDGICTNVPDVAVGVRAGRPG